MNKNMLRNLRSALTLILAVTSVSMNAQAQSVAVSGKILDGNSEDPLIGTTVMVEGTTTGAVADVSGTFTIEVNALPVNLVLVSSGTILKRFP